MKQRVYNSIAVLMSDAQFMPAPVLNRLSAVFIFILWHGTQHTSYARIGPESGVYPFFSHMVHDTSYASISPESGVYR